ncbi:DUF2905 domain-containing protein [Flectobacillus roseus]|uniref:DUF2905 domain-containing protein n=1 Tax=Flectobacillus roseus TaxID=502259 RepID=UPI0024B63E37|nr:DUF2905 domain-containing protein [Flectobacillus roseus]MDI9872827.1 DUF2905 domain-containing protein [Flectobacillus roseus]
MNANLGKLIMLVGVVLVIGGTTIYFLADKIDRWNWLGNLPGDIRIEKENFKLFAPITTSILLTIILNLLITLPDCFKIY